MPPPPAGRPQDPPPDDPPAPEPGAPRYTAFGGARQIAAGALADVARAVARAAAAGAAGPLLVFDDATGHVVDLDTRGTEADVAARYAAPPAAPAAPVSAAPVSAPPAAAPPPPADPAPGRPRGRPPGRPRLGVVAREVTLLPRHWDWLAAQPGGASAALRRLVDEARGRAGAADRARRARDAAYRVMHALAGDLPHFEEASRALFAGDAAGLRAAAAGWPRDVRAHVEALAFADADAPGAAGER